MTEHIRSIKQEITSLLTQEEIAGVKATARDLNGVFGMFAKLGKEHKSTSYTTMHKYGYADATARYPKLNTGLIQQSAKQALWCLKSWNSNNKKKKWKYKGKKFSLSYPVNLLTLTRRGDLTTFTVGHCAKTRVSVMLPLPEWFVNRYPERKLQAGIVKVEGNRVFLVLTYKVTSLAKPVKKGRVEGVDRGIYHPVATSEGFLFSASHMHAVERRYAYNRKVLQAKGTPSAKRHLRKLAGREKRFKANENHRLSKLLSERRDVAIYVLEELSDMHHQEKWGQSEVANKRLHYWSPAQLEEFLTYKCAFNTIEIEHVSPEYTSQICSVCGNLDASNRIGNSFKCSACGHTEHADINAAKNIRDRFFKRMSSSQKAKYVLTGRIQPSNRIDDD